MNTDILFETPDNPLPPGGDAGYFGAEDRALIRYARFRPAHAVAHKGTVIVLSGRNECIEKYFETIGDLTRRGFTVAMADWRGQGGSQRLLRNPERGFVRSFRHYVADFEKFFEQHVRPDCPGPYYILGHSTGGLIALMAAPAHAHDDYPTNRWMHEVWNAGSHAQRARLLARHFFGAG